MRKAVINLSDITKDLNLRMSTDYIFKQIDNGVIKDKSKTLKYKLKQIIIKVFKKRGIV